jgi:hypothetical protein
MDYKSVANKIVSYILKEVAEDEITSFNSIFEEIGYECDRQEKYKIINIVNTKLHAQGLFLDFGDPNARTGHIEVIGFKIGHAKVITIRERYYSGKYDTGSIFDRVNEFVLEHDNAKVTSELSYCYDINVKDRASLKVTVPFYFNEEKEMQLKQLVGKLDNNQDSHYNESHYDTTRFDPHRFNYCDVKINDKEYELHINHPLLAELKEIINVKEADDIVLNTYNNFIKRH